jgi:hypothetical protein
MRWRKTFTHSKISDYVSEMNFTRRLIERRFFFGFRLVHFRLDEDRPQVYLSETTNLHDTPFSLSQRQTVIPARYSPD